MKNIQLMNATQRLEKYILEHPDCWDFENELKEVTRLKGLCINEDSYQNNYELLT